MRKRGSSRFASLSANQISEVIRLRIDGVTYKNIARQLNCTLNQALYYWRTSTVYIPESKIGRKQKRDSSRPTTLNANQISEVIRLRMGGMTYKNIARQLNCTPNQALHYWKTSTAYKPESKRSAAAKQRQAKTARIREAQRQQKRRLTIAGKLLPAAREALQREIALAVTEAAHTPLFKQGDLVW